MLQEFNIEEKLEKKDFLTSFDGTEGDIPLEGIFILDRKEKESTKEPEEKEEEYKEEKEYEIPISYPLVIEPIYN